MQLNRIVFTTAEEHFVNLFANGTGVDTTVRFIFVHRKKLSILHNESE